MSFANYRRIVKDYTPAAVASANLQIFGTSAGEFVCDVVAEVLVASDGTGSVSIGTTSGGTDLASTANVGAGTLGFKGGGIANKVLYTAAGGVFCNYTVGSDTIKPVIRVSFTLGIADRRQG